MRLKRQYSSRLLLLISVITVWLELVACKRPRKINKASPTPKRSSHKATDIDDGKEHNITIIYDRVNGLTSSNLGLKSGSKSQHYLNTIPNPHKISFKKKVHYQQKFVPQKAETARGNKRQLLPSGAMFDLAPLQGPPPTTSQMFSDSAASVGPNLAGFEQDENEAASPNDGLVPVGPVENVLGTPFQSLHHQHSEDIGAHDIPINVGSEQNIPIDGTPFQSLHHQHSANIGAHDIPINVGSEQNIPIDGGSEQTQHNVRTHASYYVMPPKHVYIQGKVHTQRKKFYFNLCFVSCFTV